MSVETTGGGRPLLRIGDAAAAAGTTPRALRFYEQRGLLPRPARTASGQREYGPRDVDRVRVVRDLLRLGLTVENVRACAGRLDEILDRGPVRCRAASSGAAPGVVEQRIAALDEEIARLTRLREALASRVAGGEAV